MMEHIVFPEVGLGFYLVLVKSGWKGGSFSSPFSLLDLNREYWWFSDVVAESPCLWFVCYQRVQRIFMSPKLRLTSVGFSHFNCDAVEFFITQIHNKVNSFFQHHTSTKTATLVNYADNSTGTAEISFIFLLTSTSKSF